MAVRDVTSEILLQQSCLKAVCQRQKEAAESLEKAQARVKERKSKAELQRTKLESNLEQSKDRLTTEESKMLKGQYLTAMSTKPRESTPGFGTGCVELMLSLLHGDARHRASWIPSQA